MNARAVRSTGPTRLLKALAGAGLGAGTAVALGGWVGCVAGAGAGIALVWLLGRREPARSRAQRRRIASDLPFAADLLAAALHAGAPPDAAAGAVGVALGGPLGERLVRVERALRLGAGPAEAWGYLSDVAEAGELTRTAVRSQHSGAAQAEALRRLADDLRADRITAADAAARRAGVLIVLPLGLCFLPAFVLAGLVPVIVAVLGDVLP